MKLLVNSTPLIPPLSGIGRYTQQLMLHLFKDKSIDEIAGFVPYAFYKQEKLKQIVESLELGEKNSMTGASSKLARIKQVAKKIPAARYLKNKIQQTLVEQKFKQYRDYLYWESNYVLAPFDGTKVATVYDLSHLRYPDFHPADRLRWLDKHLHHTIENADALVAISEFSKQEIISVFNVDPTKISIVPPAVSSVFRANHSTEQLLKLKKEYELPKQFVLSVGTLEPRKNIKGLIQAFSLLPQAVRSCFPLVFVGARGWHMEEIDALLKPMVNRGEVILLGYVAQQDMPLLYSLATVFAYVSLYEGYGMPVAEAMCSGTAVLTANVASMPEVAAGCCELVNPSDIEQISNKLNELIEDSDKRNNLQEKAKMHSEEYRWENSSAQLVKAFQSII